MPKVHLYQFNANAWDAHRQGLIDLETASNHTKCGYVRKLVTSDESKVTCKFCLSQNNKL